MDEDIIEKAGTYADRRNRHVTGQLGSGIHGIVFVTEGNVYPGASALKLHYWEEQPYRRERDAYRRLAQEGVTEIRGLRIPQMIARDDGLLALEMTMVRPPFPLREWMARYAAGVFRGGVGGLAAQERRAIRRPLAGGAADFGQSRRP